MLNIFYSWRFYTFGREQYSECMNKLFSNNLLNLRTTNKIVAIGVALFSLFPLLYERDFIKTGVCLFAALIAFLIYLLSNYMMQQLNVKNSVIYLLIVLFYANIIGLGVYLDVMSSSGSIVVFFPCFLICCLLMFVNPPRFDLFLTLSAILIFIGLSVFMSMIETENALRSSNLGYHILISVVAALMSLYFNWQITKLRFGLEISTTMLEDEKNKYLDQSTVDELTQLKNRRDFMNTFQRYHSNYRTSDDFLCIALADIDFFKFYNDHYGHPQGDVCLRSIGAILNQLRDDMGVYSARVGGEEFAVLWFEHDLANVDKVVSHWANLIRDLQIPHEKSKVNDFVTMSIGVYITRCGSSLDTQTLYDLADKALYAAKGGGRNCAIITGDDIKQYKITASA